MKDSPFLKWCFFSLLCCWLCEEEGKEEEEEEEGKGGGCCGMIAEIKVGCGGDKAVPIKQSTRSHNSSHPHIP